MKSLVFSPATQADMEVIWDYTVEHWVLEQADYYANDIRDVCLDLASGRRQGRPVDVRPGCLKYLVGSQAIYFRDHCDRLEVVRILHGRMDVNLHL
jgi:toxin ParE1/3/4